MSGSRARGRGRGSNRRHDAASESRHPRARGVAKSRREPVSADLPRARGFRWAIFAKMTTWFTAFTRRRDLHAGEAPSDMSTVQPGARRGNERVVVTRAPAKRWTRTSRTGSEASSAARRALPAVQGVTCAKKHWSRRLTRPEAAPVVVGAGEAGAPWPGGGGVVMSALSATRPLQNRHPRARGLAKVRPKTETLHIPHARGFRWAIFAKMTTWFTVFTRRRDPHAGDTPSDASIVPPGAPRVNESVVVTREPARRWTLKPRTGSEASRPRRWALPAVQGVTCAKRTVSRG